MRPFDRRVRAGLPDATRRAVPVGQGEQVLAWASDEATGGVVIATTYTLAFVDAAGELVWRRPWLEAESGAWQSDSRLLTVVWVDHRRPAQWRIGESSALQQTLRERIQASVVLADEFRTAERRSVRVVIRQDFATGNLVDQVIPGKGADLADPQVAAEAAHTLARLRAEVGL